MSNIYSPKSHAPAAYIPAWLLQIPSKYLSLQAKILYGRLAQWANTKSCVHRSTNQLAEEIGVSQRVIKRFLAELRKVGLIETYQNEKGGKNYYRFLDHKWIHADLLEVFDWGKNVTTPRDENVTTPRDENVTTPRDENVTTPVTKTSLPRDKSVTPKVKGNKKNKNKSFCASAQKKPKSKSTSAAQKPTSAAKAAKSSPPKVTKAEWRKQNSVRHSFADSKTQAALSQPAMVREAQHIAESEARKRTPMPESLREQIKRLKGNMILNEKANC